VAAFRPDAAIERRREGVNQLPAIGVGICDREYLRCWASVIWGECLRE